MDRHEPIDLNAIELEARRLRAEAVREAFIALGRWVSARFATKAAPAKA